jgi:uncharacterized membrane protein YecN with MAPEG domain
VLSTRVHVSSRHGFHLTWLAYVGVGVLACLQVCLLRGSP